MSDFTFRVASLHLEPRNDAGFTVADLERKLTPESKPFAQCLAAMGLSWRERLAAGRALEIPALDFGSAQLIYKLEDGYLGASDPRRDGQAVGY